LRLAAILPAVLGLSNSFVLEGVEIVLQFRECVAYVKFGNQLQGSDRHPVKVKELTGEVDEVGE
jgi:hypothetical protein